MKQVVWVSIVVIIVILIAIWWTKKEKYEPTVTVSNCAPGYVSTCINTSIPGGAKSTSNVCPESYFEMCLPDVKYQLAPENICPPGFGIHPATNKCAPLSSIKVYKKDVTVS
jgi:hypothetical protein